MSEYFLIFDVNLNTPIALAKTENGRVTISVAFDSSAKCPRFEQFLVEVVPDAEERSFLLRWLGYTLTGDVSEQKLMFIQGSGSNGKSVLLEFLAWLMGNYSRKFKLRC